MTDDSTPLGLTDIGNVCVGWWQEDRRLFDRHSLSFKSGGKLATRWFIWWLRWFQGLFWNFPYGANMTTKWQKRLHIAAANFHHDYLCSDLWHEHGPAHVCACQFPLQRHQHQRGHWINCNYQVTWFIIYDSNWEENCFGNLRKINKRRNKRFPSGSGRSKWPNMSVEVRWG